jgi:UPF0716 family protein affecting phage T7 exclusion
VKRVLFRFVFLYFGLFCLATQIAGSLLLIPGTSFRGFGLLWPMRDMTTWLAVHLFGAAEPLLYGRNTGETVFYWVQTFWIVIVAAAGTIVWSALDRRRAQDIALRKWFRLFIRMALAASMFEYALTKVIPTQFPRPALNTLVTPVGDLSTSALLWATIGASPAYEIFTGLAELLAGILLLVPRTTMLGALICLADMTQVFALNMTYDIGLKQISFHLILLSLVLLAPDFSRLANVFWWNRTAEPSNEPGLFGSAQANRLAVALQIAFGVYLIAGYAYINWTYLHAAGDKSPRSPLYGIWNVEELSIDGEVRPAALNDYDRQWRRAIFDVPNAMAFQRLDDSLARYSASVDPYKHTLTLSKSGSRSWRSIFAFERPAADRLLLDGEMDGRKVRVRLQLVESDTWKLLNSGFRWVRPEEP